MNPRLEVDPQEGILVEWPDGHQSRYPFSVLREICPCAECRDRNEPSMTRLRVARPQSGEATTRLVRCDRVGNYAIGLVWGDGHNSGIYSWEYLRANCGCVGCRIARGGKVG